MGFLNFPETQDALVIKNWPCKWICLVIESENARGSSDPFKACAEDLAVQAKNLKIPIVLSVGKNIKYGDDWWNGRIEAAWPAVMSLDDLRSALFTREILHNKNKLGSVTFSGSTYTPLGVGAAFWNGTGKKIWRCNFKIKPT